MTLNIKLDRNLKLGSKGKDVELVTEAMVKLGLLANATDSISHTEEVAIKILQCNSSLAIDGIFGKNSLKVLEKGVATASKILTSPLGDVMNPIHIGSDKDKLMHAGLKRFLYYLSQGAREIGGNNRGPWVAHFHGVSEDRLLTGSWPWCAASVKTSYAEAAEELGVDKGFDGGGLALGIRSQVKSRNENGKKLLTSSTYRPGMLAFWTRGNTSWQGHVEMVHSILDNRFIIFLGGNRTAKVDLFVQKLDQLSFGDCTFSTVSLVTPR